MADHSALNEALVTSSMAPSTPESPIASSFGESNLDQAPVDTPSLPRIPVPILDDPDSEAEEEVFPFSFQFNPKFQWRFQSTAPLSQSQQEDASLLQELSAPNSAPVIEEVVSSSSEHDPQQGSELDDDDEYPAKTVQTTCALGAPSTTSTSSNLQSSQDHSEALELPLMKLPMREIPPHPVLLQFCQFHHCSFSEALSQDHNMLQELAARAEKLPYSFVGYQKLFPISPALMQEYHQALEAVEDSLAAISLSEEIPLIQQQAAISQSKCPEDKKSFPSALPITELATSLIPRALALSECQRFRLGYNYHALPHTMASNLQRGRPIFQGPPHTGEPSAMGLLELWITGFNARVDPSNIKSRLQEIIYSKLGYTPAIKVSTIHRGFCFVLAPTLVLAIKTISCLTGYHLGDDTLLADWSANQKEIFIKHLGHCQPESSTPWNPDWDLYPELSLQETFCSPTSHKNQGISDWRAASNPEALDDFTKVRQHSSSGQHALNMQQAHQTSASLARAASKRGRGRGGRDHNSPHTHPGHEHGCHMAVNMQPRGMAAGKAPAPEQCDLATFPVHNFQVQASGTVLCNLCGSTAPPAQAACPGHPAFQG